MAAAMMAKMADGPSWTSAMAGKVDRAATTQAPASPLNMMRPVPAAMAPSGASGPEKMSAAKDTAKTRPPNATVAPMPIARPASESWDGMKGRVVPSSSSSSSFGVDPGSPTADGGFTMRALTVDGRRAPRPLTAMRSEIRTDPSPGRPTPAPRLDILARDLSACPFGGAVARRATGRLLSTRPIAPVDAILGRVPARGGAATPRAPARLRAVVIARACYYGASAKEPLFKKFTLGLQLSSCVRSVCRSCLSVSR